MNINLSKRFRLSVILLIASFFSLSLLAETFQLGDVAPRGAPDGQLNAADSLILQKMVLGDIVPTDDEKIIGDVAPLGAVDGSLNAGDLVVQQRAVMGEISLGTVEILPPAPTITDADPFTVEVTTQNPFQISGTATPNTNVSIYVQNTLQHQIVSAPDGTFTVAIYLHDGVNDIYATEFNGIDTSPPSNVPQVQYDNTISRTQGGTISVDTVWTPGATPTPYIITSQLNIATGVKLVLQPGVTLQLNSNQRMEISGEIEILGTAASPVTLTSSDPGVVTWYGMVIKAGATKVTIDNAIFENASYGVFFDDSGDVGLITNSIFRNNNHGIYIRYLSSPFILGGNKIYDNQYGISAIGSISTDKNPAPVVNGSSIFNNVTYNYSARSFFNFKQVKLDAKNNWWGTSEVPDINATLQHINNAGNYSPAVDFSGFLDAENGVPSTLTMLLGDIGGETLVPGIDYYIQGDLFVGTGLTLNIQPGAKLEFASDAKLEVSGTLLAGNTTDPTPIYFTSSEAQKAAGDWQGIKFLATSVDSVIQNSVIEYANIAIDANGATNVLIKNNDFTNNTSGIYFQWDATGEISGNTIDSTRDIPLSSSYGIRTKYSSTLLIADNTIVNYYYGIWVETPSTITDISPVIQSNYISNNRVGIRINFNSADPVITSNAIVYNDYYGIEIIGSGAGDDYNPHPVITGNDIYGNGNDIYIARGANAVLPLNISNNWFGTPTPIFGTHIVLSGGVSQALIDISASATTPQTGPTFSFSAVSNLVFSPNLDGVKDSTTFTATLSEDINWTVSVYKNSTAIKQFTGSGNSINATWSGLNNSDVLQNDGSYYFTVYAISSGKTWGDIPAKLTILDNTPPIPNIDNTLNGSTQTSVFNISIPGDFIEDNFANYYLEYGEGVSPNEWITAVPLTNTPLNSNEIYNWIVSSVDGSITPPNNGLQTFRLTVTDLAGNVGTDLSTFTLDNSQLILNYLNFYNVSATPVKISSVKNETVDIDYYISKASTVDLIIKQESDGSVVYTDQHVLTGSGNYSFQWDGMDGTGNYLPGDAYTYDLSASVDALTTDFVPAPNLGWGGVVGPGVVPYDLSKNEHWHVTAVDSTENKQPRRHSLCISPTQFGGIQDGIDCVPIDAFRPFENVPYEYNPNGEVLYWDGRDESGTPMDLYYFNVAVPTELPNNTIIVDSLAPSIMGEGIAPNIEVKSNPYNVRHSYDEISEIKFQIDQDSQVTVKLLPPGIYDPADASAIVLMPATSLQAESAGTPILHPITWLGYDDLQPASEFNNILVDEEGMYTFTIEATGDVTGLSTLYRGALNLYH